jgi:hypothetical protein
MNYLLEIASLHLRSPRQTNFASLTLIAPVMFRFGASMKRNFQVERSCKRPLETRSFRIKAEKDLSQSCVEPGISRLETLYVIHYTNCNLQIARLHGVLCCCYILRNYKCLRVWLG